MPGPNSAPNGDTRLIRGHKDEAFVWCDTCEGKCQPLRVYLRRIGRLITGKS